MEFTPLSALFELYRGGEFYCWRKPVKTTDLSIVTEKNHHKMLFWLNSLNIKHGFPLLIMHHVGKRYYHPNKTRISPNLPVI
jgi:hypothetical protein